VNISPVQRAEAASDLRLDVFKISLSLCIYPIISTFLANIFLTLYSVNNSIYGDKLADSFMKSDYYPIYQLSLTLIPLLLCFVVLCLILGRKFTPLIFKPQINKGSFFGLFTIGTCAIPLGIVTSIISQRIVEALGGRISFLDAPNGVYQTVLFILAHVIIAPILEELIFRFLILERLRRYSDLFAVLSSAMLFSLLHSSFQSYLPSFISGIIFSLAAIYSGSVLLPILLHFLNNGLSVLMMLLQNVISPKLCDLLYIGIACVLFILALCAFFVMQKKNPKIFEFKFKEKILSKGRKASLLLLSFSTLVFIVFSLSIAISAAFM